MKILVAFSFIICMLVFISCEKNTDSKPDSITQDSIQKIIDAKKIM